MIYHFRNGFHISGDAQEVGQSLERLQSQHGGSITSACVLKEAAKKRSPLHKYFEWDDAEAAAKYRLSQANYLIRAVVLVAEDEEESFEPVRAFVCVSERGERPQVFTHIQTAMADDTMKASVLAGAKRELQAWRKRYADLEAFAELFPLIDRMVA